MWSSHVKWIGRFIHKILHSALSAHTLPLTNLECLDAKVEGRRPWSNVIITLMCKNSSKVPGPLEHVIKSRGVNGQVHTLPDWHVANKKGGFRTGIILSHTSGPGVMKLLIVLVAFISCCRGTPNIPATFSTEVIFTDTNTNGCVRTECDRAVFLCTTAAKIDSTSGNGTSKLDRLCANAVQWMQPEPGEAFRP